MADEPMTDAAEAADATARACARRACSASATTTRTGWLRKSAEFDNYRKRIDRESPRAWRPGRDRDAAGTGSGSSTTSIAP